MKTPKYLSILSLAVIGALYGASPAWATATPILGADLRTFAILGGAGVVVNGTGSVVTGSVGGSPTPAVTGYPGAFSDSGGTVYVSPPFSTLPTATETAAQFELGTAITALRDLGLGTYKASLNGLTLGPGVYSIPATTLTGNLTLDGGGNANALWVFLESSLLTTASSSNVIVQGTGAGAGVYWVTYSATLGSNSTFEGNILANQSITLGTNVTDPCGRLLTQVASVTLAGTDTIGIGCSGILTGSNGLSGGGTITNGVITPLPFAPVPEPETYAMLLAGLSLLGFTAWRRKNLAA
jgi:Ice-binding-like/PEP-CTERM motif